MKKKRAILGALFLILMLFVGFNIAEPISASPVVMSEDDGNFDAFSLNLVIGLDDEDDDEETDDDDDDDETDDDDDETDDDDDETDDDEQEYTMEQAEDKIEEAEDKIKEVEDAINAYDITDVSASDEDDDDEEIDDDDETDDDDDDDDDDALEEAQEELEDAKEHLAEAKAAFAEGDYEEAYEEAEETIEQCEEALEELNGEGSDDIDDDESAEEDAAERNLHVTVLINGQDATSSSEGNPIQVSGDVTIRVIIENNGETVIIDEVEIKTSTGDTQVSAFELSGATLSSGTSAEFTNTVDTGLIGALAELFGNPLYESKIEIKMENDWDYELVVYWQAV